MVLETRGPAPDKKQRCLAVFLTFNTPFCVVHARGELSIRAQGDPQMWI